MIATAENENQKLGAFTDHASIKTTTNNAINNMREKLIL